MLCQRAAEDDATASVDQGLKEAAAHGGKRAYCCPDARAVDHLRHLNEAALKAADLVGKRSMERYLTCCERAGTKFVLQPVNGVGVALAIVQYSGDEKQAEAARAGGSAFRPGKGEYQASRDIGAEPLITPQLPFGLKLSLREVVRSSPLRYCSSLAHIRSALFLGQEHGA